MDGVKILRITKLEENRAVGLEIACQIGGDHDIVAVAKEGTEHPAKHDLDQRLVLLGRRLVREVRPLQHHVVHIEPAGETVNKKNKMSRIASKGLEMNRNSDLPDLKVFEEYVTRRLNFYKLNEPLQDDPDKIRTHVDKSHAIGLPEDECKVGKGFLDGEPVLHQFIFGLHLVHSHGGRWRSGLQISNSANDDVESVPPPLPLVDLELVFFWLSNLSTDTHT